MTLNEITIPIIRLEQPLGGFFIGQMGARELVDISYADVRRIGERDVEKYLGIQRPLDKGRVKKIRQYLRSPDATFPTGIVLAVDEKCAEFDDQKNTLTLRSFESDFKDESVPLHKIAKVLDGQHRIDAFNNESTKQFDLEFVNEEKLGEFKFNVVIFIGLDIDEQANIFATVNLAQTKVNKSLVYDLEGLSRTRSPFRTCHFIAVALDSADSSGPLYQRIKRLGVKTKGRINNEPLTQAGFVEALVKLISQEPFQDRIAYMKGQKPKKATRSELTRNPFRNLFIEERDNDIALIVHNYFKAVRDRWPTAWEETNKEGNLLPRSNAFKALMRYLRDAYLTVASNNIGMMVESHEFLKIFNEIEVSDNDFTSGNFKPGSAGESAFYKLLRKEKTIKELKA